MIFRPIGDLFPPPEANVNTHTHSLKGEKGREDDIKYVFL